MNFRLYNWIDEDKSFIILSGAFWIRSLIGFYLLNEMKEINNQHKDYVTFYMDILFIRIKILRIEI